ncbi:MAG: peptidase S58 [Elusimicrobia bacterium GWA2_69_24]|nr:MAG: peptidase S58 [Elusimicrobia bacterium GWA2_69_24]HBL16416.1 peptidase S58 [Elusimicrobiota bacterium]
MTTEPKPEPRCRIRELGLKVGRYRTGKYNAITDVEGVRVGHSTIIRGAGKLVRGQGPVRTGVTAIVPKDGEVFMNRAVAGGFVLHGAGEVAGMTQLLEWGILETPILLTNTLSVGACSEALVEHMLGRYPGIGIKEDVIIPIVGECDDSWLNDIGGRHVRSQHVIQAIESAESGPVAEGSVGGGTGMVTCGMKSGIGTSSRRVNAAGKRYTVGVLVMSNFGVMEDLRIDGFPAGRLLVPRFKGMKRRTTTQGSIIAVLATDAPLLPHQLNRLAKRVGLGIGRVGSYAAHSSGEIVVCFSTANSVPRCTSKMLYRLKVLLDDGMDPLYEATLEATEEAILNSLTMAEAMRGAGGNFAPAMPLDIVRDIAARRAKALP